MIKIREEIKDRIDEINKNGKKSEKEIDNKNDKKDSNRQQLN